MSRVDVKVVLLGSSGSGKTSLVERFLHDRFEDRYMPTIGAAFGAKRAESYGKLLKLGVWDTAGQERYKAMSRIYYRGAKAAVVCYDLTVRDSFREAKFWVQELLKQEDGCKVYLCGTKADLLVGSDNKSKREVDYYSATDFADEINESQKRRPDDKIPTAQVFETSSKTGTNVCELFQQISDDFVSNPVNEPIVQELDSVYLQRGAKPHRPWSQYCCTQ